MTDHIADLEISIMPHGDGYSLALRFTRFGDAADIRRGPFAMTIDAVQLRALSLNPAAYGDAIRAALFTDPAAVAIFSEARAIALSTRERLRVRLLLPADLHAQRWETLLDPASGRPLATDGDILLSRYLIADDYQPVVLRPQGMQRALVIVSSPQNTAMYGLAPIDNAGETRRVSSALGALTTTVIGAPGGALATWDVISDRLRAGCDLLYLLAHGALIDGQPWLYLLNDQSRVAAVEATRLADLIRSLGERRPRLVVLASCQSAGDGHARALAALGPLLAQAGVPAVVAMQGQISTGTVEQMMPIFLTELLRDGFVDRALAVARLAVADRPDWWMPVLYSRLRDGRIWEAGPSPSPAPAATRGLPAGVLQRLRQTLLLCDEFDSNRRLRTVFSTVDLKLWQSGLPEAESRVERVDFTISYLLEKRNRQGQRALALLISALLANTSADDDISDQLREIAQLIT